MNEADFQLADQRGLSTLIRCTHTGTAVQIPQTVNGHRVEAIGRGAFLNDAQLESVILPDSVLRIDDSAFQGCGALKNIHLPNALNTVGIFAFADCDALTEIFLPDDLQIVSYGCFSVCTALVHVHLPKHLITIANRAFEECRSLTDLIFPEGLTEIGNAAFYNCPALGVPKLPDSLTSIGHSAFYTSPSIGSVIDTVELPPRLELVGARAFRCRKLVIRGNTDLDTADSEIQMIYAPNIDPVSFTQPHTLSAACSGFAEMTEKGVAILPSIADSYRNLIEEHCRDLYPLAVRNPSFLRYLLRMEILPPEDAPMLIDLCAGQTESVALLLQYIERMNKSSFDALTLEETEEQ